MADVETTPTAEPGQTGAGAPGTGTPESATPTGDQTTPEGTPPATPPDQTTYIEGLKRENVERRHANKELSDKVKTLEAEKMTEAERAVAERDQAVAERDTLKATNQDLQLSGTAMASAVTLGFQNPDIAVRLIDREKVEWDDDGQPANIENLLKVIAEKDPYLLRAPPPPGNVNAGDGRKPSPPPASMSDLIREKAGRGRTLP